MNLSLVLDPDGVLAWHADLAERLQRSSGARIIVSWSGATTPRQPRALARLMRLEQRLHGHRPSLAVPIERGRLDQHTSRSRDVPTGPVLDLTGSEPLLPTVLRLTFDGRPELDACLAVLLAGRLPLVEIRNGTGDVLAAGRPAVEAPNDLPRSLDEVLARTTTLIVAFAGGVVPAAPDPSPDQFDGGVPGWRPILARGVKAVARAGLHLGYRKLYRTPHWRVGWRVVDGPDLFDLRQHPEGGWHDLPDDGTHFYADPAPIVVDGRTWLFVEDLPHATGKGVISAVAFDETGPVGAPAPVLERDTHLSYPFVIEEGGEIWMIPETSAAHRVELFRSTKFPGGWDHVATLVDGVEASDATPFRHGGRWWMAATVRDGGGSWSDALHLWSAPALVGPWRPHRGNPVLIDAAAARPAGRVVERARRLLRPVQDCRGGYGAALALAEITRLDDESFDQRVVARIGPGPLWPGRKLHTLNRAGGLEFIDGSALSARWRAGSVPG